MADLNIGSFAGPIVEIAGNFLNILLYIVPILLMLVLSLVAFYYMKKVKKFDIDAIIHAKTADNNLVIGYDKAGVVKNTCGGEELLLKKRKKALMIPDRKFWILNEKGKFTINFYKYSEEDYAPIKEDIVPVAPMPPDKAGKKDIKGFVMTMAGRAKQRLDDIQNIKREEYRDAKDGFEPIDVKGKLSKVEMTPIAPDTKTFLSLKSRENTLKWHKPKPIDKILQFVPWVMIGMVILGVAYYGFSYSRNVIDKGYKESKTCLEQGERIISKMNANYFGGPQAQEPAPPKPPDLGG